MAQVAAPPDGLASVYSAHRRYVWGLCYRMTGSAADADDLVQDTFARAMTRPPADTQRPWRPWLGPLGDSCLRCPLAMRRGLGSSLTPLLPWG